MSGDPAPGRQRRLDPVRPACAPFELSTLERPGWRDLADLAGPVLYGLAAHLAACRLTFVMRWLKTDDGPYVEDDPMG